MKRVLKLLTLLIIFFLTYQIFILFFVKEHSVTYKIGNDKEIYKIKEDFQIENQHHLYTFEVEDKNHKKYYFQIEENYHKRDKILEKIESYSSGELYCIYPVFYKQRTSEIICQEEKQSFVGTYLETKKDTRVESFQKKLKKKGYTFSQMNTSSKTKKYQNTTYYPNNISENQLFYFWTYQGIISFENQKKVHQEKLVNIDQYENNKSILVDDLFVEIDTDQKYDFNRIYIFSLFSKKKEVFELKEKISQDCYFLGNVGNKVYLMDRKHIKEYEIDIKKKTCKIIGDKELNAKYYNGEKWVVRNIYDFIQEDIFFEKKIPSNLQKMYPNAKIIKENKTFYLLEDNTISYINEWYPKQRIYLISFEEIKDFKVLENHLFFVYKDTVYTYQEKLGLLPIFTSRELLFHEKNMYGVSFKN